MADWLDTKTLVWKPEKTEQTDVNWLGQCLSVRLLLTPELVFLAVIAGWITRIHGMYITDTTRLFPIPGYKGKHINTNPHMETKTSQQK